jgi:hypothetical protein
MGGIEGLFSTLLSEKTMRNNRCSAPVRRRTGVSDACWMLARRQPDAASPNRSAPLRGIFDETKEGGIRGWWAAPREWVKGARKSMAESHVYFRTNVLICQVSVSIPQRYG